MTWHGFGNILGHEGPIWTNAASIDQGERVIYYAIARFSGPT